MQNGACVSSSSCSPDGKAEREERERGPDPEDSRTREETKGGGSVEIAGVLASTRRSVGNDEGEGVGRGWR